ncbi:metallophosphoesterase [Epibacterium ulvae]|nr:metallophosphoesterase [Epibacterium ulvae]
MTPAEPFYAIGDIHGCFEQLADLLRQLKRGVPVVCLGDYVDRGPNSAAVLHLLQNLPEITCLRGNHEEMLLRFLDDPAGSGQIWLRHGGLDTLASYGVAVGQDPHEIRDDLLAAMGADTLQWLEALPRVFQSGNVVATHAGADPSRPIAAQDPVHLTWGHPQFLRRRRRDGHWVVHGHVIVPRPELHPGRIAVDTGAYATGSLSAALVLPDGVQFLTVHSGKTQASSIKINR